MSLNPAWERELTVVAVVAVWLVALGFWSGYPLQVLLGALALYLVWTLFQLYRFARWLQRPKHNPQPANIGFWHTLRWEADQLRERSRKRKKKLSRMLSGFQESTSALPDATVVLGEGGEMEWWNGVADQVLGLDRKTDRARRLDEVITDPIFRSYLEAGDYARPLQMPAPVDDTVTLEVRIVPYGKGKRLLQARDISRLQQLETVRRDFVANVSHEMRTPLTVVYGYLETMADAPDQGLEPWVPVVRQMQQQTGRMQRIVEDLLVLSRLENQESRDGQEALDVANLMSDLREEALGLSGAKHHIEINAEAGLRLLGNSSEIESAFSNLVFNAVRYTPPGGVIRMHWRLVDQAPCFSVQDTGIGIAPQHIPRLTERFYRVDVGRSRQSGGTGLGLAIVKHALTRHDGYLRIESAPGEGSTFTCCFPRDRVCF